MIDWAAVFSLVGDSVFAVILVVVLVVVFQDWTKRQNLADARAERQQSFLEQQITKERESRDATVAALQQMVKEDAQQNAEVVKAFAAVEMSLKAQAETTERSFLARMKEHDLQLMRLEQSEKLLERLCHYTEQAKQT